MSVGYLACSFDLLNVGHLDLIDQARARCERLVVGVFSDAVVEQESGRPPVVPLGERAALLEHVRGVDQVVVHHTVPDRPGDAWLVIADPLEVGSMPSEGFALSARRTTASAMLRMAAQPAAPSSANVA